MEVTFLLILLLAVVIYHVMSHSNLSKEVKTLDQILRGTLSEHEKEFREHKESTQELAILTARFESLKSSTLTPENSVPKHVHAEKLIDLCNELNSVKEQLSTMTNQFEESRGKQISERVRLGNVGENFAAFHNQFPYDRQQVKALFQPIDLIYFGEDEIVFIDVKTGAATLSSKQRRIRDNIRNFKVRFEVHRLDENGYKIEK